MRSRIVCSPGVYLVFLLGTLLLSGRAEADKVVVVTPETLAPFYVERGYRDYLRGSGAQIELGKGPAPVPLGTGSLLIGSGPDPNEGAILNYPGLAGKKLRDLRALSYKTYIAENGTCNAPYLVLGLDVNGDGVSDDRIVFEPCYQTQTPGIPDQGAVARDTWQKWDVAAGGFWLRTGGPPIFSLASYLAQKPEATLVNAATAGLRISGGFGVTLRAYVDELSISFEGDEATTFDFEPGSAPVLPEDPPDLRTPDLTSAQPDLGSNTRFTGGCSTQGGLASPSRPWWIAIYPVLLLLLLVCMHRGRFST